MPKTKIWFYLLFFLLVAGFPFLIACGKQPSSSVQLPVTVPTNNPSLAIQVSMQPFPAKILKENEFTIQLPSEYLQGNHSIQVEVQLDMPDMKHPSIAVLAAPDSNGAFVVKVIPTMPGKWEATITLKKGDDIATSHYTFTAEH